MRAPRVGALWLAFALRFDWRLPRDAFKQLVIAWPWVVGLQYALLAWFRVPRFSWRFVGLRETRAIVLAVATSALVLMTLRLAAPPLVEYYGEARYLITPIGVIGIDAALVLIGITGVRTLRRIQVERRDLKRVPDVRPDRTPTILIGAGSAGLLLAREIERRPDLGLAPVGFVDDDPHKRGAIVHGITVLGTTRELTRIRAKTGARQALITIARLRGEQVRAITASCDAAGLQTKIIPPMHDILSGVNISQIRDVAIEDLLGRNPVVLDELPPSPVGEDKIVFVTGAGGSIGSELCRQLLHSRPRTLVLIEQAENNLFDIHRELARAPGSTDVVPAIADVCDEARMRELFRLYRPEVVFHAAAHKHVPMMEANPGESVKNNVLGTRTVATLADEIGCDRFVFISTDKAVNPSSVMGATKRLAEVCLQAINRRTNVTLFPRPRALQERSDQGPGEKTRQPRAQTDRAAEREGASGAPRPVPEGGER